MNSRIRRRFTGRSEPTPVGDNAGPPADAAVTTRARDAWLRAAAVGLALALVAIAVWWGRRIDPHLFGNMAAPLLGRLVPRWSMYAWWPVAIAVLSVIFAPAVAARLRFRWLLVATWLLASAWAFALAGWDGLSGVFNDRGIRFEYLAGLVHVQGWDVYLAHFSEHIHDNASFVWPLHVAGNPAGALLFFSVLQRIGLGGTAWGSVVVVLAGASAAAAATWTLREIAGSAAARRAAPFLALAPMAIWVATSADALFLGVSAWGIAFLAAAAGRAGWRGDAWALGGGLILGEALYLSYGIAPMGALALAVVVMRRRFRPLVPAAIGVAAVAAVYTAYGFLLWDGLRETNVAVHQGVQEYRSYGYFLLANLAALAIALGPAAAAGLATLYRVPRIAWLVGGIAVAVAVSDLSGISKGEVERIWLPFMPWLLVATASLTGARASRAWLAAQLAVGLLVQGVVISFW